MPSPFDDLRPPTGNEPGAIPTAPRPSPQAIEGLAGPSTPSVPTPGVSMAATRIPTAPTLPDDPTHFTAMLAQFATDLYGVGGGGIGSAPELSATSLPNPGAVTAPQVAPPVGAAPSGALPEMPKAVPAGTPAQLPAGAPIGAPASAPGGSFAPAPALAPGGWPADPSSGGIHLDGVLAGLEPTDPIFTLPLVDDDRAAPTSQRHADGSVPYFLAPRDATDASRQPHRPEVPVGEPTPPPVVRAHPHASETPVGQPTPPDAVRAQPQGVSRQAEPRTSTTDAFPTSTTSLLAPHLGIDLSPRMSQGSGFDAYALREEFPILREVVHGKRLVWLDNAATTQKPQAVIDRLVHYYSHENSNIHRAAHALAARATDAYEGARESVRRFLNARSVNEVVFVRGATEAINLVAQSWGRRNVEAGDEILITWLEHHANIVPWQMLAKEKGARLRVAPVDDDGQILLDEYEKLISSRTKIVALPQVSNALGTVTPAKLMIDMAHRRGVKVLLDGAQSVSHMAVDLQELDCDFFVFSGHKVFAPTGIGAVVTRESILQEMPPWQGGGNMIQDVTFERTSFQPAPSRFEAGTGNIADAVGLGTALDWLSRVGLGNVERHEHDLLVHGTERLLQIPGLTLIGTAKEKAGVLSFVLAGHDTQAVSTYLDKQGIAVRGGHHCAQPILRRFGRETTVRASLAPYNTREDIDALVEALWRLVDGQER